MRIALDVTPAVKPRRTGVGWYTAHLARELALLLGEGDRLLLCTRLSRFRQRRFRPPADGARTATRWFQGPFGPRGAPEIFHGPDARLPEAGSCRLVATVHDVFSLQSESFATERFREQKTARYADIAERAARIIFPSDSARREYLSYFPEAKGRDAVVHQGVGREFEPVGAERIAELRSRYALPERFALYVGEISTRKNLPEQARGLAASGTGLPWVWAGASSFGAESVEREMRAVEGIEVIRLGYLPPEDLPALYASATLLTFVTRHEGFGLPALEAMACGTPAVVAGRGALPEVTGGFALEADPGAPEEIAAAIRSIATDEALAEELGRAGRERARCFSWERTARETLEVYRAAAAGL